MSRFELAVINAKHFDTRLPYLALPIKHFTMQGFSTFTLSEGDQCGSIHYALFILKS